MKITKKMRSEILSGYKNLNVSGSFTSATKIRNSLGLQKIPIKIIEEILTADPAYVAHRRGVKKFNRRKFVAPGVMDMSLIVFCVFDTS